jgi:hypothetical protein
LSELSYDGTIITDIKTLGYEQQAVYDPSNTDYLYTKVSIKVQGVINANLTPADSDETPAATMIRIRKCLMAPRKQLYFSTGGDEGLISGGTNNLITSPATGFMVDANNGPKPISLSITSITVVTFIVVYEIETYLYECCSGNGLPYSSNRWKETHDIDAEGYITRTIDGQVIFRSDMVSAKTNPGQINAQIADYYRGLLAPPHISMLAGFVRVSRKFMVSEDGLQLAYTITDKQQYCILDNRVTRFEGTRAIKWKAMGGFYTVDLTIRGWSPPTVAKQTLIAVLAEALAALQESDILVTEGSSTDNLHENYAELTMHGMLGKTSLTKVKGFRFPFQTQPMKATGIAGQLGLTAANTPVTNERGEYNSGLTMLLMAQYLGMCSAASSTMTLSPQAPGGS